MPISIKQKNATQSTVQNWVTRLQLALPDNFRLENGGYIKSGSIAYSLYGNINNPCILVLGGISAGRDVAHTTDQYSSGWWNDHIGPNKAVDLNQFCVLGIDYLGGNGHSSAPHQNTDTNHAFRSITTGDQAKAISYLSSHLSIGRFHSVIGCSYGGMVSLAMAQHEPHLIAQLLVVSAAHESSPLSTAFRYIQRQITQLKVNAEDQYKTLSLARSLAMLTYRCGSEIDARFTNDNYVDNQNFRSPVVEYLEARGKEFCKQFTTNAYCCLSESIDLHRVDPSSISLPVTCVAIKEDQLIPNTLIKNLAQQVNGEFIQISSNYGHDAFLKETKSIAWIIKKFIRGYAS